MLRNMQFSVPNCFLCRCAVLIVAVFCLFIHSCTVPSRDAIVKALEESDNAAAVKVAKHNKRSVLFLARQILHSGALANDTKSTALELIAGGGREIIPVLDTLKVAECEMVRAVSLMKLHSFGKGGALASLKPYLNSDHGLVRAAAVEAYLRSSKEEAFYRKYAIDSEAGVRLAVARRLIMLKTPWSRDLLYEMASRDPDRRVRQVALASLDPRDEKSLELLKSVSLGDDPILVAAALLVLSSDPATANYPWMQKFLSLPVTADGILYAGALLRHKKDPVSARAAQYLEAALRDKSPTIRQKAMVALAMQGAKVKGVEDHAQDPAGEVRLAWSLLARKLGLDAARRIEVLVEISNQKGDLAIRALIALSEEKRYDSKIRARLWHLFKNSTPEQKIYILAYAGRAFDDPLLCVEAMADPDPIVRLHAASATLRVLSH